MKKRWMLYILFLLVIISASSVLAQTNNVLEPIAKALDSFKIAQNYEKYPYAIDFIIALFIFIGVARTVLGKRLGNAASTGIGIALSIALVSYEYKTGFSIGAFGAYAVFVIILLFGFMLFKTITKAGAGTGTSVAIAIPVVYFLLLGTAPEFFKWLAEKSPLLHAVILLIAFISAGIAIARIIGAMKGGASGGSSFNPFKGGTITPKERAQEKEEKRLAEKGEQEAFKKKTIDNELSKLDELEEKINSFLLQKFNLTEQKIDETLNIIQQLENSISTYKSTKFPNSEAKKRVGDKLNQLWQRIHDNCLQTLQELERDKGLVKKDIETLKKMHSDDVYNAEFADKMFEQLKLLENKFLFMGTLSSGQKDQIKKSIDNLKDKIKVDVDIIKKDILEASKSEADFDKMKALLDNLINKNKEIVNSIENVSNPLKDDAFASVKTAIEGMKTHIKNEKSELENLANLEETRKLLHKKIQRFDLEISVSMDSVRKTLESIASGPVAPAP